MPEYGKRMLAGHRKCRDTRACATTNDVANRQNRIASVSSNSFGKLFTVTTFGESHGPAIGCVIDGCPPGLAIEPAEFRGDLERRATGRSRYTSQRHEADEVEIVSGVFEGRTTGTPIALLVRNTDQRSKDYAELLETFRPGHADYTYWQKYGIRDPRGGGRSSARETTMRVAAGVVAKKWLAERHGIRVRGYLAQIGDLVPRGFDWDAVEGNPFFWPDPAMLTELEDSIDCFDFLNRLNLVISSSHLGDNRTLAIPIAHTIYWEMGPERRAEMGIAESLIRLSIGIEDVEDLIGDFKQALQ